MPHIGWPMSWRYKIIFSWVHEIRGKFPRMGFSLITRKPPSVIRVGNKISFLEYREEACANCRGWEWNGGEVGRTEKPALSIAVVNHSLPIPLVSQLMSWSSLLVWPLPRSWWGPEKPWPHEEKILFWKLERSELRGLVTNFFFSYVMTQAVFMVF